MNELTLIPIGTLVILGAVSMLLPMLTPRRYYFGLTVEPGFPESEPGRGIRRGYLSAVGIALILAAAFIVAFPPAALPASMLLVPLVAGAAFFHARSRVQAYSTDVAPVREAELSRGPERLPLWALLALPPFAIPFAIAAYLQAHWEAIPARFAVHWGLDGQPNGWETRTPHGVYGPLWFSAAIMAMLIILGLAGLLRVAAIGDASCHAKDHGVRDVSDRFRFRLGGAAAVATFFANRFDGSSAAVRGCGSGLLV